MKTLFNLLFIEKSTIMGCGCKNKQKQVSIAKAAPIKRVSPAKNGKLRTGKRIIRRELR
jgi:hypothetical protein